MKKSWYRSLKEQFSKFSQHSDTEKVQWGCIGLGKSTELYEEKQHLQKKKKLLVWQINQQKEVARCAKAVFQV